MRRNQAIAAEQINQRQGLNNRGCYKGQHDDIPEKGLSAHRRSGHGISVKENNNRDDNGSDERYVQTVPQRSYGICCGEIFLEIRQGEIGQAELAAFEKAHLQDDRQGEKHKKAENQADKNGDGGNDESINFHPCGRNLVLWGYGSG